MAAKHFPPIEYLRECFAYEPETGCFAWRNRPLHHFPSEGNWRAWNARWAGKPAFVTHARNGYARGRVSYEGQYFKMLAHRVAWAIVTGEHPKDQIDHVDRDRANNKFANLREATNAQNAGYSIRKKASGLPRGVAENGPGYSALFHHDGHYTYLGTFPTPEQAHDVWREAAVATRGDFVELR